MVLSRAVLLVNGSVLQGQPHFLATEMRSGKPAEKHAKEFLSRARLVGLAIPRCQCLITHLRIDSAKAFKRFQIRRIEVQLLAPVFFSSSDLNNVGETAEEISQQPEVRKELERATGGKPGQRVKASGRDKFWFVMLAVIFISCVALYFLVTSKAVPLAPTSVSIAERILRGTALIVVLLAIARTTSVYGLARIEDASTRFTLQRVARLVVALVMAVIAVSIIFVNWYGALAALGIGSVIIGLALQTPMKSFIAWIYILVRQPFRVGDRIQIGEATGDVIDVGYLDTTLWEFGGKYLSGDHPSGRLIKFPNEKVLDEIVYNYSWPLFPYVWNEIKFYVAFNADLEFIANTMQKIAEEELGEEMLKRVETFRDLLARTPVDELEVRERPRVLFRVNENTWLEAIVRYLVAPREAGRVKTRLIKKLLVALNTAPEKVMFPAGANR
jgi:small-conductance mechanosensitive channel